MTAHGDEADRDRAEFIRVQCELARGDLEEAKRNELAARAGALLQAYEKEWRAALPEGVGGLGTVFFERGFPGLLATGCEDFPMLAELLWPVAPITAVYINGEGGWMSGDLEYEDVGPHHDRAMPIFAATPQRVRVRSLTTLLLRYNGIGEEGGLALAASPRLDKTNPFISLIESRPLFSRPRCCSPPRRNGGRPRFRYHGESRRA